jgi:hypothetical protein
MDFNFSGIIRLKENKIDLVSPMFFRSPIDKIYTVVKNYDNDDLLVEMEVDTENLEKAQKIAELELRRVSNIFSWFENMGVEKHFLIGHSFPNGKGGRSVIRKFTLVRKVDSKKILDVKSQNKLMDKMKANFSNSVGDLLLMWNQALRENSNGMKFFLLYRLLEKLIDPSNSRESTKKTDEWLKKNHPNFPIERGRSVLTFLRDNVHAKSVNFPFKKIDRYINDFQNIVREVIENKFPIELSK